MWSASFEEKEKIISAGCFWRFIKSFLFIKPLYKKCPCLELSGPFFPAFGLNTDQNNSEYEHFSRSEYNQFLIFNRKFIGWIDQLTCSQYKLSECFCCKRASYKILSYIWLNVYLQKQLPEVFYEKRCS